MNAQSYTKTLLINNKQADSIHQLVSEMTTEEKIGQLFFVIGQDEERVSLDDFIDTYKPGGLMFPTRTSGPNQSTNQTNSTS